MQLNVETAATVFGWAAVVAPLIAAVIGAIMQAPRWAIAGAVAVSAIAGGAQYFRSSLTDQMNRSISDLAGRAKSAEQAWEKFKQPRLLGEQKVRELAAKLKQFSGTRFDTAAIPGDPEAVIFASHIAATLEIAGWTWVDWNPPSGQLMMVYNIQGKPNIGQFGNFGVTILLHPEYATSLASPAKAITEILVAEGFESSFEIVSNPGIPNKDTVHVTVGKKR